MSKNLNRRIHPIAEAYGLSPKKLHKHSRILAIKPYSPRNEEASVLSDRGFNYYVCMERKCNYRGKESFVSLTYNALASDDAAQVSVSLISLK